MTCSIAILISCGQQKQHESSKTISINSTSAFSQNQDTNTLKVYVTNTGTISADGQEITLTELDNKMKNLKNKNSIVYYSRDNPKGNGPKESLKVMDLIAKYDLTFKFFTDKSFTVAVKLK